MSKAFVDEKRLLPEYPRTRHLPYKPNAARDDLIVTEKEAPRRLTKTRSSGLTSSWPG